MAYEPEQLKDLDIAYIVGDEKRFGPAAPKEAENFLNKLKEYFLEFEKLGYLSILSPEDVAMIQRKRNEYLKFLSELGGFDLAEAGAIDAKQWKRQHEERAVSIFNDCMRTFQSPLVFLRQEVAAKNIDQRELSELRLQAVNAKDAYEKTNELLKSKFEELNAKQLAIESKHGENAVTQLAVHFADQAEKDEKKAEEWLKKRSRWLHILEAVVGFNFSWFLFLFFNSRFHWVPWVDFGPKDFFTIDYAVIKLAAISILSYAVAFASKNYKIYANLAAVNRHRRNVGQTLQDFMATNPTPEDRSEMLRQGTEALLKHQPIGYITKNEQSTDRGPLHDIITNISGYKQ